MADTQLEVIEVFDMPAWLRRDNEPEEWYEKFVTYYLSLGPSRTLLKAFTSYVDATYPKADAAELMSRRTSAPNSWSEMARAWDWRERAKEFDRKNYSVAAQKISEARLKLQTLALDAVNALETALKNPKTSVAAAERILDRAGLPAKSVLVHEMQPYTSDDYARAAQEVDEWQKRLMTDSNG